MVAGLKSSCVVYHREMDFYSPQANVTCVGSQATCFQVDYGSSSAGTYVVLKPFKSFAAADYYLNRVWRQDSHLGYLLRRNSNGTSSNL